MRYTKIVKKPVEVRRKRWNIDGRGSLIELVRSDEIDGNIQQVYLTTIRPGVIKAWHLHEKQTDRMMLVSGLVRFVVWDSNAEENTKLDLIVDSRDPYLIIIPPNLYHGFQNIGNTEAMIINSPDALYNRKSPDEHRIPYNRMGSWDVCVNG